MLTSSILAITALAGSATAHYKLLAPTWRGDSFEEPASQWIFPCANVNETTDIANRTQWPLSGGSVSINGSHSSALTYVNLGLGTNVTNFNISLVENLNQTGAGVLCLKEAGRANLEEGLKAAGYSGFEDNRLNGLEASVQVIQLSHSGSALYNCADIVFNSTAQLLADDQCVNGTGVGAQHVGNLQSSSTNSSTAATPSASTGAGSMLTPVAGSGLLAGLLAWGML
ncbi:hypothetical protein E8E12_005552 [Didymella heteroderae]|uniref:Copper acquisition factor BIM1-like domain-containing protein n=1 Tax=Didymella heteroderae TaxID=1769908 RepID=A0A9P4WTW9_9PLEO|nr:hypothetical protein E8E12_005552 [Didymella heteroderae]